MQFGTGQGMEMFSEFGFAGGDELFNEKMPGYLSMLTEFTGTYETANKAAFEFGQTQSSLSPIMDELTTFAGSAESGFSNLFSSLITGSASAKEAFASMGESMIRTLSDLIAKHMMLFALQQVMGLLSAGTSTKAVQADLGPGFNIGDIAQGMTFGHEGGMVTAAGIRKYHTGGSVLKADEVPAILQVGERIIPKGGSAGKASVQAPPVEVHIHNEGEPLQAAGQTTRYEQGKMVVDLFLERMNEHPNDRRRVNRSLGT